MFQLPPLPRTLSACQNDLNVGSEKVRLDVARDLAKNPPETEHEARVQLLLSCLKDESAQVRRQAVVSLADLRARSARDELLEALRDPEIPVRQMAVMALGEVADPRDDIVLGRLAALLNAGSAPIRYQALLAYSHLRPQEVAKDLEAALADSDAEIRQLAARLVDESLLADSLEIPASLRNQLQRGCRDEDPSVRLLCQLTLGELGEDAPRDAITAVVERRQKVREPRDEQWAIELAGRLQLRETMAALGRRAFGFFGLSTDPFRWIAQASLCRMGDERALNKLLQGLRSRRYIDRVVAVHALGMSARREARDALEAMRQARLGVEAEVLDEALANLAAELPGAP